MDGKIKVFDFFCGCGGTSAGLKAAGMDIVAALDADKNAASTYKLNFPEVKFFRRKIQHFKTSDLQDLVSDCGSSPILFSACAPCQPFTKQKCEKPENDERRHLLRELHRFVKRYAPHYIFLENVPGLQKVSETDGPFSEFLRLLSRRGYQYDKGVVVSSHYGVPQVRSRLVLLASRVGPISLPEATHGDVAGLITPVNVWDVISELPAISAGESHASIKNHRAAGLSDLNMERIRATPVGGSRKDWPKHLVLDCHKDHSGHTDVYGRLIKDRPAPALTTRCISLSNGRYGHPEQDRAISVREAAAIQTFPNEFEFLGSLHSQATQIGNAVPVALARVFGEHIINSNTA